MYLQLIPPGMMGLGMTLLFIAVAGRSRIEENKRQRSTYEVPLYEPFPKLVGAELWEDGQSDLSQN